jgi:hypothetical protein
MAQGRGSLIVGVAQIGQQGSALDDTMPTFRLLPRVFRLVLPLTVLASCGPREEAALKFTVELDARLRADCVSFVGLQNGSRTIAGFFVRSPGKHTYTVGVPRQSLPATLTWQARAVTGSCGEERTWKTTSLSEERAISFPDTGVRQETLTLDLPGAELDADRDTFVDAAKNGEDCNDADGAINPGAMQPCGSSVDTNCDGKLFCDDPTCAATVTCQRPASRISFLGAPMSLLNHECSGAVQVATTDGQNQEAAVVRTTTITLVASDAAATGLELFSDPSCATPLAGSTLTLSFGQSSAVFSFRARTTGTLSMQASAPTLGMTSFSATITEQPIAELRAQPQTLTVASTACSSAIDVSAFDAQGRPTRATTPVDLTAMVEPLGTTGVEFFSADGCAAGARGTPRIATGASTTSVWLRATQATPAGMPLTVRLGATGVATPATVAITVTSGAPTRVEFREQGVSIDRAVCGMQDVELRLFDAQGNRAVAGASGAAVTLNVMPPSGGMLSFFTAAGCAGGPATTVTIPAGQDAQRLFLTASLNGRYTVTATLNAAVSPALEVSVAAMPPTALVFPNQAVAVVTTAGACSRAVRVQTRETTSPTSALSGVTGPTVVNLETTPAGRAELFSDAACLTPLTSGSQLTFARGVSEQTFYFRGRLAGAFSLEASRVSGDTLASAAPSQPAVIDPGLTTRFDFTTPLTAASTADGCAPVFSVLARDDFNNPTRASGFRVTPLASPALTDGGVVFFAGNACSTPAGSVDVVDGGASFWARARVARDYTITAQSMAPSAATRFPDGGTQAVTLSVGPAAPTVLAVTMQPPTSIAAGTCHTVTIERRDAFGNLSPGAVQGFTATPTTAALSVHTDLAGCMVGTPAAGLQFGANQATASFAIRGRTVGMGAVTVSGMGSAMTAMVNVTPGPAARLEFDMVAATSTVGVCATGTVRRRDGENNLTTLPAGLMGTLTASGVTTNLRLGAACPVSTGATTQALAFGTSNAATFAFEPRASGVLTFTATATGVPPPDATASTTVGAGAVASVRFVNPPTTPQLAATCIPLTLEALDASGVNQVMATANLATSLGGTFHLTMPCSSPPVTSVTLPANGALTFFYRPTATGMHLLTATVGALPSATATFQVNPGDPTQLVRTPDFMSTTESRACVTFTLERRDAAGNPTTRGGALSVMATLTGTASATAELFSMAGCTGAGMPSIPDSASTGQFSVRPQLVGDLTLALSSTLSQNPMNTITTVGPGALASLRFTTTPPPSAVVGSCTLVTLEGRDAAMNLAPLSSNVTLSMMGSSATFHRQADCMDAPNATITGSANTSVNFYVKPTMTGVDLALTATTAGPLTVSQNWTFTTPAATALRFKATAPGSVSRLSCTGPYRFESTDGMNAVPSGADRVITFGGATVQWFSDPGCSTPITTISLGTADQETNEFYFVVFGSAPVTLTGTAAPALTVASANVTVSGSPGALTLALTAPNAELEYRACTALTIERQVMGMPFGAGNFPTVVNLSKTGSGSTGATFHTATDCTGTELTAATIPSSMASVTVYVAGRSAERQGTGPAFTVATATATGADQFASGFGSDSEVFNVHPAVRRGSCTIATGQTSSTATQSTPCTIAPPLPSGARDRSFFTFQATFGGSTNSAANQNVRCSLSSAATPVIECARNGSYAQQVDLEWQLVSLGQGLSVQHLAATPGTTPQTASVALTSAVNRGTSFLLASHSNDGGGNAFDDFVVYELTGAVAGTYDAVQIRNGFNFPANFRVSLQVVTWAGLSVEQGVVANSMGASWTGTPVTSDSGTSALLFSNRIGANPASNDNSICRYRVRGWLSAGVPTFRRGNGTTSDCTDTAMAETTWARLSMPSTVGEVLSPASPVTFAGTTGPATWTVGRPLPLDRSWAFLAGQGPGGQATGETNHQNDEAWLNTALARLTYGSGATTVELRRGSSADDASFTPFVVVLAP